MMKDEIEQELPEGEVEEEQPVETPKEPEADPESEAEARKYGWRPKSEFDKDPAGWVDAKRFLEIPQTQVKMLRDLRRNDEREKRELREQLARIEGTTKTAIERVREQEKLAYEARIAELEKAKREAAEVGDLRRYDDLQKQQANIRQPAPLPEHVSEPVPQAPPELIAYQQGPTGAWVNNTEAVAFGYEEIERNPSIKRLPVTKQLQWAEARVREFFPELFPQQPQPMRARVDGGGLGGSARRGKGPEDLPPEARQIGSDFVKEGVFKSLEDYAREYFAQEAR